MNGWGSEWVGQWGEVEWVSECVSEWVSDSHRAVARWLL